MLSPATMNLVCLSVVLLLIGFLPSKGSALTCYSCNSRNDPGCGDPFKPYTLGSVNCSLKTLPDHINVTDYKVCRKIVQKVEGEVRVVRECGYIRDEERDDKACASRHGTHNVHVIYCSCTTDLCNSGFTTSGGFLTLAPLLLLAVRSL